MRQRPEGEYLAQAEKLVVPCHHCRFGPGGTRGYLDDVVDPEGLPAEALAVETSTASVVPVGGVHAEPAVPEEVTQ